jgi:hypothetical protein
MKYCPQCNRQYTEPWLTFCSDDGTMLIEELSRAADPNWDPVVREPKYKPPPSEQRTQWLPRDTPAPGGWVAPDERPPAPMRSPWQAPPQPAWQPPPPPPRPFKQQNQSLALASMLTGILGLVLGCLGPLPGVAAVILGWLAISQINRTPESVGGKPMAIIGIVTGGLGIVFYGLLLLWLLASGAFGSF